MWERFSSSHLSLVFYQKVHRTSKHNPPSSVRFLLPIKKVEKIRNRTEKSNTEETALPTWRKVHCLRVQKYPGLFWEEMTGIREKHDIRHIPLLLWKYFIKIIHQIRRMQERGPATQKKTEDTRQRVKDMSWKKWIWKDLPLSLGEVPLPYEITWMFPVIFDL